MPNRDGVDTRNHEGRRVDPSRWRPSNDASQPAGTTVSSSAGGHASVTPQPWGFEAGLSRSKTFYESGPFRTEFRGQAAAGAMANRADEDLKKYRSHSEE